MPEIRKEDTDRERERLRANIDEFPELSFLLDDFPEDYDPRDPPELAADDE